MKEDVRVRIPCTTANFGPGYDVFALALDAFHDEVHIRVMPESGLKLELEGKYARDVPENPDQNCAGLVARELLVQTGTRFGVKITLRKEIPVGKGLGSSAASAAGTVCALNHLFELGLSSNRLVELAAHGEIASAGSPHADNVAAAILGSFTFVQSLSSLSATSLPLPSDLAVAIVMPDAATPSNKTRFARALLPSTVPLKSVTKNIGSAASIIAGIITKNISLIGKGMADSIVEPARSALVPGYAMVRQAALSAGAEGVAISGAGPSMIAVVDTAKASSERVAKAMREALESVGIKCQALVSKPDPGATLVGSEQ